MFRVCHRQSTLRHRPNGKILSAHGGYSLTGWTDPRTRLLSATRCLLSNRRIFDASVGLVLRRIFGLCAALRINSTSRSVASSRFRPWVRNRRASIISMPSSVTRLPASEMRRFRTSSGRERELATSKRSCTAVATLLTFCPPGPEARTKYSWISLSSIVMVRVMWIIPQVYTHVTSLGKLGERRQQHRAANDGFHQT